MITVNLQSLLELSLLLFLRPQVRRKAALDAASCTESYARNSTCFKSRLVIVSAVAIFPFRSAGVTKLCFAATTAEMSVRDRLSV